MSDTAQLESQGPTAPEPPVVVGTEDRLMPGIVYALYLLTAVSGFTVLIGLVLAYVSRDNAGPKMASHYEFLIRTFWISLAAVVVGGLILAVSLPLMLILIGFPLAALGGLLMGAAGIWFTVRAVVGVVFLARDEAYPRPKTWLV